MRSFRSRNPAVSSGRWTGHANPPAEQRRLSKETLEKALRDLLGFGEPKIPNGFIELDPPKG